MKITSIVERRKKHTGDEALRNRKHINSIIEPFQTPLVAAPVIGTRAKPLCHACCGFKAGTDASRSRGYAIGRH